MAALELPSMETLDIRDSLTPERSPGESSADTVVEGALTGMLSSSPESQFSIAAPESNPNPVWRGKPLESEAPWSFPAPFVAYISGGNSWDQIWGPPPRTVCPMSALKFKKSTHL